MKTLDLFTAPLVPLSSAAENARHRSASKHEAEILNLIPVALELARKAGSEGITVCNLRLAAVQRGLLPSNAPGRALSFLGSVMKRAGLVGTENFRRSITAGSNGNLQRVWKHA